MPVAWHCIKTKSALLRSQFCAGHGGWGSLCLCPCFHPFLAIWADLPLRSRGNWFGAGKRVSMCGFCISKCDGIFFPWLHPYSAIPYLCCRGRVWGWDWGLSRAQNPCSSMLGVRSRACVHQCTFPSQPTAWPSPEPAAPEKGGANL